jgi:hypothetical protein
MAAHESSINYQNLIKDLAEMYPFDVGEVIIVELVANALDAKATTIGIEYDVQQKTLVVSDNGEGMKKPQFDEYHDFAAGLKTRGTGIGFAGVGAKISFNIAKKVVTQTKNKSFSGGSNWYLASKKKLVWEDIEPDQIIEYGTRVEVHFKPDATLPFANTEDIVMLLKKHYMPLMDKQFLDLYETLGIYPGSLKLMVNGKQIDTGNIEKDLGAEKLRIFFPKKAGKRIGYGYFFLSESEYPLGADLSGVLLCTHGKVVKADFFNQFPGILGPKIFGIVEIPEFISFLTTAKTDFMRGKGRNKEFERLYDPIRREFKDWLAELGVQSTEMSNDEEAGKLERELKKLVDELPELADFFGFRSPKQTLQETVKSDILGDMIEGAEGTFPIGSGNTNGNAGPLDVGDEPEKALVESEQTGATPVTPISRTAKKGPKIAFAALKDRIDIAWMDGNHVIINSGHPSYNKVKSDNLARRTHCFFAIGTAIQRFLIEQEQADSMLFVDRLMAAWGKK